MTKLRIFQVDAFARRPFEGNPAAVCPLDAWLPDSLMQEIAEENNLAETAFFVAEGEGFALRWFTPATEVDLCGHATLASAHVLYERLGYSGAQIRFATRSGELRVARSEGGLTMDFPASMPMPCAPPPALLAAFAAAPRAVLAAEDYLLVFDDAATVASLVPDFERLRTLDRRGVVVTAPGATVDFVSRFFAPRLGVPEDPVTGSAHCELAPYWAERLGKARLSARQLSKRGGEIDCELRGERVLLRGRAVTFLEGWIEIDA